MKHTCGRDISDPVVAGRTPGRRRCSRCSSSVCVARTPSLSGSPALRTLSRATSGAAVDTCRSSGAAWTVGGSGTRSPERKSQRGQKKAKQTNQKKKKHTKKQTPEHGISTKATNKLQNKVTVDTTQI